MATGRVRRSGRIGRRASIRLAPPRRKPFTDKARSKLSWDRFVIALPGLAATIALFFTAESLDATRSQLGLAEQGQVADRFKNAMEQLGAKEAPTRLGGIYGLERLMLDSPRDFATIVQVLSAYVRERAPVSSCEQHEAPATDIQAAITVLARRGEPPEKMQYPIDLRNTCLRGIDFSGGWSFASVSNRRGEVDPSVAKRDKDRDGVFEAQNIADFREVISTGSDLSSAYLQNTLLDGAVVNGARFTRSSFALGKLGSGMRGDLVVLDGKSMTIESMRKMIG